MIVMKFGGSSIESAEALERVARIVAGRASRQPVVVVSAMGKTTDRLLAAGASAAAGKLDDALKELGSLKAFHQREAHALIEPEAHERLDRHFAQHFEELEELLRGLALSGSISPRSSDLLSSFGERLSSFVVTLVLKAQGLPAEQVDARRVIITDDRFSEASPLFEETNRRIGGVIAPLIAADRIPVMGGFIASTADGATSTLGRGGSDFTASIVGAALGASEVEIWTDVDGVMTADPSIVASARRIKLMSFAEAAELAYFGARVLHPSTMVPAVESSVAVRVLNSRKPEVEGTLIVAENPDGQSIVKSVAYKENITVVEVRSTRMLMAHGFLAKIFEIFERYETPVDMVTTSEVSVSLTIDSPGRLPEIVQELGQFAEVGQTSGQVIMCVVGDHIRYTPGIAGKIFKAVDRINIRMISQGASRLNLSFVVDESDLRAAVTALHETLFAEIDEKVFA